jgi:trigger factor
MLCFWDTCRCDLMKATVEKLENNRVALHVEIDESRVDRAMEQACRQLARQMNVAGFRRGRVPRPLIERRLGREAVLHEALQELWPQVYEEAVIETAIEAISVSEIGFEEEYEPGKPLKVKAEVEVKPEATLGEYRGIAVERRVARVTDEDVDDVLQRAREQQAVLVTPERVTVEQGDHVTVDYVGFVDEAPFPGGAATEYTLRIGSGQPVPGFDEQLIGAQVDEEREVKAELPTGYGDLSGKEAVFRVTIRGIKERRLPALDDDFAKDVSEFGSLSELRAGIRGTLESRASEEADARMQDALTSEVSRRAEVEVPEVLVEQELDQIMQDLAYTLVMQGLDPSPYLESNAAALRQERRPAATARAKTRLVLEAIAVREGIVVTPEEVDSRIEEVVQGAAADRADEVRKRYQSPLERKAVEDVFRVRKALELVTEAAVITEKMIDGPAAPEPQASPAGTAEPVAEADSLAAGPGPAEDRQEK